MKILWLPLLYPVILCTVIMQLLIDVINSDIWQEAKKLSVDLSGEIIKSFKELVVK